MGLRSPDCCAFTTVSLPHKDQTAWQCGSKEDFASVLRVGCKVDSSHGRYQHGGLWGPGVSSQPHNIALDTHVSGHVSRPQFCMTDVQSFMDSEDDGNMQWGPLSVSDANRNRSRFLFNNLKKSVPCKADQHLVYSSDAALRSVDWVKCEVWLSWANK